jgi:2,3-bisphosphoglycerate-dependent phosphoglycerate mutase
MEDPPLTEGGIEDAKKAGRLLKRHGFEFDVVYTSWLTRAMHTAHHALAELDCVLLPLVKSWRLNERMYTVPSQARVKHDRQ